MNPASIKV